MRPIDIGIGHQNNAKITELVGVELFSADAATQGGDQGSDFHRGQHLVETRFFNVQNLAFQRQDRLKAPVAALLGRAAGGIALHQKQL